MNKEIRSHLARKVIHNVASEAMESIKLVPYYLVEPFTSIIRPLDARDFVVCPNTGLEQVKEHVIESRLGREAHRQIICQMMYQITFN